MCKNAMIKCFGCGGVVPDIDGDTHSYMLSTPGCWAVYGELLARSYADFAFPPEHRFIVDAYAVQHPGEKNNQAIHSVALHLIRLHAIFDLGRDIKFANSIMLNSTQHKDAYTWLEPPKFMGDITVVEVGNAKTVEEFQILARDWSFCAWMAWQRHHPIISEWANL
jgi:hypothetical protein